MKKIIFTILIVCVLLLAGCMPQNNVSDSTTKTTTKVANTPIEEPKETCKMVQIPYQVSEEEKVDYKYQVISQNTDRFLEGVTLMFKGTVMVKNTEKISGNFTVIQTITTTKGKTETISTTQSLQGGEAKPFKAQIKIDDNERGEMTYTVTPAKKTIAVNTVTKYVEEKVCSKS